MQDETAGEVEGNWAPESGQRSRTNRVVAPLSRGAVASASQRWDAASFLTTLQAAHRLSSHRHTEQLYSGKTKHRERQILSTNKVGLTLDD